MCAYVGKEKYGTWSITQTCSNLFRGLHIKASAISLLAYQPHPSANARSLPCDGSASPHQLLRDNQGILCWDGEESESRGTKPLHQGIKILSQEVRNTGQAKSLSTASLGEDLKGINQQTSARPRRRDQWRGNS